MRRILLLSMFLLLALILIGCTPSSKNDQIPDDNGSNSPVTETPKVSYYTVTWLNHDSTVLERDVSVQKDSYPIFNGPEPTKKSDNNFHYIFIGWSPSLNQVTKNITYTAQFQSVSRTQNIIINSSNFSTYFNHSLTYTMLNRELSITVTISPKPQVTTWSGVTITIPISINYSWGGFNENKSVQNVQYLGIFSANKTTYTQKFSISGVNAKITSHNAIPGGYVSQPYTWNISGTAYIKT